jgi:hypothetical protein
MPAPIQPGEPARYISAEELAQFNQVPNWYTVTIALGPEAGATQKGARQLRPEPFVAKRIQWATTGDTFYQSGGTSLINYQSPQGRVVRCRFGDSFTSFLGQRAGLVSAVFGDSQGFLDLPRMILFSGKQNLEVELNRLFFPASAFDPEGFEPGETRWDFVFAGVSLLPPYVNQSGSE